MSEQSVQTGAHLGGDPDSAGLMHAKAPLTGIGVYPDLSGLRFNKLLHFGEELLQLKHYGKAPLPCHIIFG